ncbi:hypothetical protein NAEGRDRAFT_66423 [Naegleria gruberi]|uniref:Transglutaminase-like domain-containing protein n=1 Tax=Naegleria gruberi TaxID=5762 RepID=D2VC27_NAEGR|nr:uncharacterized protein NAEGRDRAFT_66423 [Naegleria gruberi]EFC45585.1 hypothetical protein NAEGRDRAFT_66423 [Naegleria gruberi]|eukprot:XP_002678329.1 hypothetical protein NAEGRDRAFT_66423 [Naegleria gruberi strain NEG-M]
MKPKGQQCVAFGDQVKKKFEDEESFHSDVLVFEHFKMLLHNNSSGNERDDVCIAHNGKTKPLTQVIGETLKYLVDRTVEEISSKSIKTVQKKDIMWVLTVPAIWTWKAKSIMRNAMREYGQIEEKFIIEALEPECASITLWQENPEIANQSKTAMIVDIGGGTVDISVHKLNTKEKRLESKLEARGGAWGGRNIDRSLFEFMQEVLKFDFTSYKFKENGDYFDLTANIEDLKVCFAKDFDPRDYKDKNGNLSLNHDQIKYSIVKRIEEYKERTKTKQVDSLQRKYGIKISFQILFSFYMKILQNITSTINEIITQLSKNNIAIDYIYLAGGMAEAKVVVDEIKNSSKNKQVAVVTNPQTAIVRGAVYYGLNQNIIKTRVSTFTYGLSVNAPFNPAIHDTSRKIINFNKEVMCKDCFLEIVKIGEEIDTNQIKSLSAPPTTVDQTVINFNILQTKKSNPKYADEKDVEILASISIDISDCLHLPIEKRTVTVNFMFGATIIYVNAINEATGKQENVYISFDYTSNNNNTSKRSLEEECTSSKKTKSNPTSTDPLTSILQKKEGNSLFSDILQRNSKSQHVAPILVKDNESEKFEDEVKTYDTVYNGIIRDYKPKDFFRALFRIKDIPQKYLSSYSELAKYLTEPFTNVEDKAKVIYAWITHNIAYDVYSARTNSYHNDPIKTFKERKGVCGGYAALFQAMMFQCDVPSTVKINGRSKSVDGNVGSHAWSAVQLENGQYFLLDCTWGAGFTSSGIFERHFNPNYFFVNPKTLISTHLPDNDKWQFLEKTVTPDEYYELPVITQHGINNGLTIISNKKKSILLQDTNRGILVLQANPNLNWDADLKDLSGNSIADKTFVCMNPVTINDVFVTKYKGMEDARVGILHPLQKRLDSDKEWTFVLKNPQGRDLYFSYDGQYIPLVKVGEFQVMKTRIPPNAKQISICFMEGEYWVTICRYDVQLVI